MLLLFSFHLFHNDEERKIQDQSNKMHCEFDMLKARLIAKDLPARQAYYAHGYGQ